MKRTQLIPAALAAEVTTAPHLFRPGVETGTTVVLLSPMQAGRIGRVTDVSSYTVEIRVDDPAHRDGHRLFASAAWAIVGGDEHPDAPPLEPGDRILVLDGECAGEVTIYDPPPVRTADGSTRITVTREVTVGAWAFLPAKPKGPVSAPC